MRFDVNFDLRFDLPCVAQRKLHRVHTARCPAPKLPRLRQTVCPQLFLFFTLCSASRVRIGFSVVLVTVNLAAFLILLMLDLIVLSRR